MTTVKYTAPDTLTASQEEVLLAALSHNEAVAAGYYTASNTEYGPEWFAVSKLTRSECEGLELAGYLERNPAKRLKMWYRLTALGQDRAEVLCQDREQNPAQETPASATPQEHLEYRRRAALRRLIQELAFQGFVILAEAGRGPELGEIAFVNMFSRETRLYRCPIGSARWEERDGGYYPADPALLRQQAALVAIPF